MLISSETFYSIYARNWTMLQMTDPTQDGDLRKAFYRAKIHAEYCGQLRTWCEHNTLSRVYSTGEVFFFEDPEEALVFKLKFG